MFTIEKLKAEEPKTILEANRRFGKLCGLYNAEKDHNETLQNELNECKGKLDRLRGSFEELVEKERARVTAELIATYLTKLPSTTPDATDPDIVAENNRITALP